MNMSSLQSLCMYPLPLTCYVILPHYTMGLTQYIPLASLQCYSFNQQENMLWHIILSLSSRPQMLSGNYTSLFFFFFTLLDNYATLSFSPQTFSTAGLDSPTSKEHDSYFTNNTEKNLCDFPTPQPPTYLTLVPIFLPSFPHPCSCRGQIFSLYTRSHTSYFLRDINPLTIFTSLLHL